MNDRTDVVVVGAGIVGLATARAIVAARPTTRMVILEKERGVARHQSGRNSGVLHTGAFYPPGSLKARFCSRGRSMLLDFVGQQGLPVETPGKLVVAATAQDCERLDEIGRRAQANNVPQVERLDANGLRRIEPNVRGMAGLWLPTAAIVDFNAIAGRIAEDLSHEGVEVRLGCSFEEARASADGVHVRFDAGVTDARFLVNCAGLFSDQVAWASGSRPPLRILPFRGEYVRLGGRSRDLVRGMVYPVPDPRLPFLGIHLTPRLDGTMEAGPNAVLALAREGYRRGDVDLREVATTVGSLRFLRFLRRYGAVGIRELRRSLSAAEFARAILRVVPEVDPADLTPSRSGVRAQAVSDRGQLVDDFVLLEERRALHVLNAPSPAASSSFAIGEAVAERVLAGLS
ncbi:MAG: L-2-hydroxyglutarate oxidase [Thermoplasmata archaeon]|nr:L-2-hydroxyglutarate oxidase [Thermoplasmata archaeon]